MSLVDEYRMSNEIRDGLIISLFRQNMENWGRKYKEYKAERGAFGKLWQQWHIDVCALGADQKRLLH